MPELPSALNEFYAIAIDASIIAGAGITEIYNKGFEVSYKADQSPLTDADLASHKCIEARLAGTGLPILSEEGIEPPWSERKKWKRYWLVDPLDGTKEFVKRNGEFTVNIALMEDGFPIFGVIYIPVGGELYFGGKNEGAFRSAMDNEVSWDSKTTIVDRIAAAQKLPAIPKSHETRVMISRSHFSERAEAWLKRMEKHFTSLKTMNIGSSIKFCRVAEGGVQIYPRFSPTMQWDTAAGQAIAEGAGMMVVSLEDKKRLSYHREVLLNPDFMVYDPRHISPEAIEL